MGWLAGEPAPAGASPEEGRMGTRVVVTCSRCGAELPLLPAFGSGADLQQWLGSVCPACGKVYCATCCSACAEGPAECPSCGTPTVAARSAALHEAGVLR
jgi:hypothetical protein